MLYLQGQVINCFQAPKGTLKDGTEYGGQAKIQIMGDIALKNGEYRKELLTLSCDAGLFSGLEGQNIVIPVGVMATGKAIAYFIPKGSKPRVSSQKTPIT
ncbi:hypothetical protein [Picosynechococcus sp. NKBG042902]|uniref:hypothetical protein n=1 Tax=Picosynechococcus sp. NKBG042902 TaxID=490193 RepID=UPI0004AB81A2|nr:hypothetical protein [Picosynechococcus sp. NKBG042902]